MILVRALLYVAVCVYLAAVLPATGEAFAGAARAVAAGARHGDHTAIAFLAGAVAFVPSALVFRSALRFWYTLTHEMAHGITALCLGGSLGEMSVSATGEGRVTFTRPPLVLWVVLLAPYVVNPSYLLPLAVPWLASGARLAAAVGAGAATAFALMANALQVRAYQSDILRAGLVRSLLFIAWGNLLAAALAATLVTSGGRAAVHVLRAGVWPW